MAYLKPSSFFSPVANKIAMRLGWRDVATLAISKRTSGDVQELPVIPVEHGGARFIVSTRGESEWVRNLRAAGQAELKDKKGRGERVRATEIPVEERPPVLEAYRKKVGREVDTYFKRLPDPADHPTFRLEPAPA